MFFLTKKISMENLKTQDKVLNGVTSRFVTTSNKAFSLKPRFQRDIALEKNLKDAEIAKENCSWAAEGW